MARKAGSEAERVALDRLKDRRDRESKGYTEFFAVEDRRRRLSDELDGLDVEAAEALAAIAEVSDVVAIADVIEWSPARVRTAVKLIADRAPADDGRKAANPAANGAS
ncbi:MAG: hypothetical protein ACE37B_11345 [Ilumatobacter sp.]|uniref:hypothetical protein n=1 Tax=Ilumatobacter sp. TaxID=1967498 RepID=UPI00391D502A